MISCYIGNDKITESLLKHNADVNIYSKNKMTALMLAIE